MRVERCGYGVCKFGISDIEGESKDEWGNYGVVGLGEV